MSNEELLMAISDMMDSKLDSKLKTGLQQMKADIQEIKAEQHAMKEDTQEIKAEQHAMKEDTQAMKAGQQAIKAEVQVLKGDIRAIKAEQQVLKEDMQVMKIEMRVIKEEQLAMTHDIRCMKLFNELELLPRLNTIEDCYTSTYERYKDNVNKMEEVFDDVDVMKKVIIDHSEKLQKLA